MAFSLARLQHVLHHAGQCIGDIGVAGGGVGRAAAGRGIAAAGGAAGIGQRVSQGFGGADCAVFIGVGRVIAGGLAAAGAAAVGVAVCITISTLRRRRGRHIALALGAHGLEAALQLILHFFQAVAQLGFGQLAVAVAVQRFEHLFSAGAAGRAAIAAQGRGQVAGFQITFVLGVQFGKQVVRHLAGVGALARAARAGKHHGRGGAAAARNAHRHGEAPYKHVTVGRWAVHAPKR